MYSNISYTIKVQLRSVHEFDAIIHILKSILTYGHLDCQWSSVYGPTFELPAVTGCSPRDLASG